MDFLAFSIITLWPKSSKYFKNSLGQCFSTFRKTVRTLLFNENFIRTTNTSSSVRRKFSWGFHSVAYGGHFYFVSAVCDVTIKRHIHVSKPTFWRILLT